RLGQQARAQTGGWQIRHRPVAATLDEFGVTFDRHDPAAWEIFREVTGWRGVLTAADALQQSLPAPLHVRGPLGVEESLNARVGDREYREEVALPPVGVREEGLKAASELAVGGAVVPVDRHPLAVPCARVVINPDPVVFTG